MFESPTRSATLLANPSVLSLSGMMEWYYAVNNDRLGPVSEKEFQALIDQRIVTGQTLVWREPMVDWAPLASTLGPATAVGLGAVTAISGCVCTECGQTFPAADVVQIMGSNICVGCKDRALDKMRMGMPLGSTAWRDGKKLVIANNSQLSDNCVKCSLPAAGGRMKRKYTWHPPLIYVAFILNILLYIILALCFQKTLKAEIGVCRGCRIRRRWDLLIGWVAFIGGIAVGLAGLMNEKQWGWAGPALFLFGLFWLIGRTQMLTASRIREGHAWLRGCHKDYLAKLPEWVD